MNKYNKIHIGKKYEKELRDNASATERIFKKLWNVTKRKYGISCRVNFQKGWYKDEAFYISDFYFSATKCTIELDGQSHEKKKQKLQDERKVAYLSSIGVRTLRMENRQVWNMTSDQLFQWLLRNRVV